MYKGGAFYATDSTHNRFKQHYGNFQCLPCQAGTRVHHKKTGYGDLVIMSIETYEEMLETAATDAAIAEAEAEFAQSGELHDAEEAFEFLRRKYFG